MTAVNRVVEAGGDTTHLLHLVDAWRRTPGGGSHPLTQEVRESLTLALPRQPHLIALLALDGENPVGCAVGFHHLYLFAGQPVANIQFLFVQPEHQRCGIARKLLQAFEDKARTLGCCRLTLEVRAENVPAKSLYAALDYRQAMFGRERDALEYWEKPL
jgi:ribosomal protein S18 acetylase RimI-like enzyme